jgi:outer membrane cobalamin receptor
LNINLQSNFYGAKTILLMNETTHQTRAVELENFSLWKLTTTHTFKSNYQMRLGVENIFNYIDSSGGYNTGTPGRTFFVGLGITI